MGGGFGGKGGKTTTYKDIQIQSVFPDRQNIFKKKLLTYKHQLHSNHDTFKKLILDKSNYLSVKKLEKMGFIHSANGLSHHLTKQGMELYITNHTEETNINIKYKVGRKYKHSLFHPYQENNGDYAESEVLYVWTNSLSHPSCESVGYAKSKWSNDCQDKCDMCDVRDINYYNWKITGSIEPSYKDLTYEILEFIDYKIEEWLRTNYDIDNSIEIKVSHPIVDNRSNVDVVYNGYIIDDKTYKPIIESGSIKREIDEANNVIKIKLVNINDSDDIISLEYPTDDSLLCAIIYTSKQKPREHVFIDYYDKMIAFQENLHFFAIPIKHSGSMVKHNMNLTKLWFKNIGMTLPTNLEDSKIKDVLFALMSKYNNKKFPNLDKLLKMTYGDYKDPKNISIDTGAGIMRYEWYVDQSTNPVSIKRRVYMNGFKYKEILDTNISGITGATYNYENDYKCCYRKTVSDANKTEEDVPLYILPIEGLKQLPLHEFYDIYYSLLHSIVYSEVTVHTKWYQTMFFQFMILATITVMDPIAGFAAAVGTITYNALINFGVAPTIALVVTAIITWGTNTAAEGANSVAVNSATTATVTGADMIEGAMNALTSSFNDIFTSTSVTLTGSIQTATMGVNILNAIETKHEQKKLNNKQHEANEIATESNKLAKKLKEVYENSITLLPNMFDDLYTLTYSNPMELQVYLDHKYENSIFDPINQVYM